MMKKLISASALAAALCAVAPQAQAITGNQLYEGCAGAGTSYCLGYVTAWFELSEMSGWQICSPKGVNYQQMADIVTKFLRDHPERRHEHAVALVRDALMEAFTC